MTAIGHFPFDSWNVNVVYMSHHEDLSRETAQEEFCRGESHQMETFRHAARSHVPYRVLCHGPILDL